MKRAYGFTIVELLIVIVVIAILAAISVAAYTNITDRANDSAVRSDLSQMAKKLNIAKLESGGEAYPTGNTGAYSMVTLDAKITRSAYSVMPETQINLLVCQNIARTTFAVLATSKSGRQFYVTDSSGVVEYTGSTKWNDGNYGTHCDSVPGPSGTSGGAGYNSSAWRDWAAG